MNKNNNGYTLVELLISIALLLVIPIIGVVIYVIWHFISKLW